MVGYFTGHQALFQAKGCVKLLYLVMVFAWKITLISEKKENLKIEL